ncbi:MAG: threonine synthase [Flavobacteriaceae bacterium]|nr:MAG: threonine synthase [Flavobacteriaceae bacterium]
MLYKSLNGDKTQVDFKTAVLQSLAKDKGLFYPTQIPTIDPEILENFRNLPLNQVAYEVIKGFVGDSIPKEVLEKIIEETLNFPTPVVPIENQQVFALELFHGPTMAFKDVGARFMARCLGYFLQGTNQKTTVLVATSGDTGGAVADGFYKVDGINVIILYPSGKVSPLQEKQLTSLGANIKAIEVKGTFDDCQDMVKQAFLDDSINQKYALTSANSINVARWLPQMFYYISALQQVPEGKKAVFSVPSGNFGNICAAMMLQNLGFPISHFIASTNANNVVTQYLSSEVYQPKPTVATISNAMDVSSPSNFIRIQTLYQDFPNLQKHLSSYSFSDEKTREVMREVFAESNYTLDPHGAVAFLGLKKYLETQNDTTLYPIFLETAHPIKFVEVVEETLSHKVAMPSEMEELMERLKVSRVISPNYADFVLALEELLSV